jgi:hypothetical protein
MLGHHAACSMPSRLMGADVVTFKAKVLSGNLVVADNVAIEIDQKSADNWKGWIQTLATLEEQSQYQVELNDGRRGTVRIQSVQENKYPFTGVGPLT